MRFQVGQCFVEVPEAVDVASALVANVVFLRRRPASHRVEVGAIPRKRHFKHCADYAWFAVGDKQSEHFDAKCIGQDLHRIQLWVGTTAFDPTHVAASKPAVVSERLLRKPCSLSQFLYALSESFSQGCLHPSECHLL